MFFLYTIHGPIIILRLMNSTSATVTDLTASSSVTSAPTAVSASAETPAPAWTEIYFAELDRSCNTAAAAAAAGVPLPAVIRHRRAHPVFATRENDTLAAIPELLLCEALRRATQRAADAEASAKDPTTPKRSQPRFGSDALLVKLLRHFIPGFGATPKSTRATRAAAADPTTASSPSTPDCEPDAVLDPGDPPATNSPPRDLAQFLALRQRLLDELQRLQNAGCPPDHPSIQQVRHQLTTLYARDQSTPAQRWATR